MSDSDLRARLDVMHQFVHLAPIGLIEFAADGHITLMNPAAERLLDPAGQCGKVDVYALLAPIVPDLAQVVAASDTHVGTIMQRADVEVATPDGSPLVVSFFVQRVHQQYLAGIQDTTQIVLQERQLSHDAERFRAILDGVGDYAIYFLDRDGHVTKWNRSIERIAGWRPGDVEDKHISNFLMPHETAPARASAVLDIARREGSAEAEGWRRRRDGTLFWASTVFVALRDEAADVWGFVCISRDLTERKRMEDELRMLAVTDPLTGAYNRRYGQARLVDEVQRRERYRKPLSIMMLDIDRFKSLNDRFGHEAGDVALRALVTTCASILRATDVFVRWGGEEFLVIMPETPQHAAADAAERICAEVAALRVRLDDETPIGFTVSIGVAEAQDAGVTCLLNRADTAMYAAKRAGRNRVIVAGQEPHVPVSSMI